MVDMRSRGVTFDHIESATIQQVNEYVHMSRVLFPEAAASVYYDELRERFSCLKLLALTADP